jgi:hypothetical protein
VRHGNDFLGYTMGTGTVSFIKAGKNRLFGAQNKGK